jgi:hypothetical protein
MSERALVVAKWTIRIGRIVLITAAVWGLVWIISTGYEARDQELKFIGVCEYLGGKVVGEVCIKDRVIVLWRTKP